VKEIREECLVVWVRVYHLKITTATVKAEAITMKTDDAAVKYFWKMNDEAMHPAACHPSPVNNGKLIIHS